MQQLLSPATGRVKFDPALLTPSLGDDEVYRLRVACTSQGLSFEEELRGANEAAWQVVTLWRVRK
jgi:hypothetical protein